MSEEWERGGFPSEFCSSFFQIDLLDSKLCTFALLGQDIVNYMSNRGQSMEQLGLQKS